nr:hypothetical protein [Rhodoferax sp.]
MKNTAERRTLNTVFLLAPLLMLVTACADLNDTGLAALATRVQAYAVVNEQLVQGEMTLYPNHTGTVALRVGEIVQQTPVSEFQTASPPKPSVDRPILNSCLGRLRYTATAYGAIDLRCNDGSTTDLRIALIGETRGYGYGQTATGLASLTFGMAPTEARAHLTTPPGKQLQESGTSSGLEMK